MTATLDDVTKKIKPEPSAEELAARDTAAAAARCPSLTCGDVHLSTGPHVSCHGKGRCVPERVRGDGLRVR
jgi:hypothetical protein